MDNQNNPQYTVPHSHKNLLYIAVGFSLIGVILLAVALLDRPQPKGPETSTSIQQGQNITPHTTEQTPIEKQTEVTPLPITNDQEIGSALEQIDNADPSTIGADLNQNTQDASAFSQ